MVYFLYGTNEEEINDFVKQNNKENININNYSEDTKLDELINDLSYTDIFSTKRIDVIKNPKFLNEKDINYDKLINYINDKTAINDLYIIVKEDKLDERKKIIKILKENSKYFPELTPNTIEKHIKNKCLTNSYTFEDKALKLFINKLNKNYKLVNNELEKLFLYKIENKNITVEDVKKVTSYNVENNIFKLIDSINEKNKKQIINTYNDLIFSRVEPIMIIGLLSKQYRLYLQIKILIKEHKSKNEIEEILKEHPYRLQLATQESYNFSEKYLVDILYKLSKIDEKIKTEFIDDKYILENFLLDL